MKRMDMNDEEMQEKLEKQFFEELENGEDIGKYLYLPDDFLSTAVKAQLDAYLCDKAYFQLEIGMLSKDSFIAYMDDMLTVDLKEHSQRIELLDRMIVHFEKLEEYEKCSKIQQLITEINS